MINFIYMIFGFLSLITGMIGIVLPVLPTTPFVLLALYLFAKGSSRFHNYFTSSKLYQIHLKSFVEMKEMTKKQKWCLMIFVDLMLLVPFILINIWFIRVLIVLVDASKYYYFTKHYTIKTV